MRIIRFVMVSCTFREITGAHSLCDDPLDFNVHHGTFRARISNQIQPVMALLPC